VHATPVSVSSGADVWMVKFSARTTTVGLSSRIGSVMTMSPGSAQISGTVSVAAVCALARPATSNKTTTAHRRPRARHTRDITLIFLPVRLRGTFRIRCCALRRQELD